MGLVETILQCLPRTVLYTSGIPGIKSPSCALYFDRRSSPVAPLLASRLTVHGPSGYVERTRNDQHLDDGEANGSNLYPDPYFHTHLERYSYLHGRRRFASASSTVGQASSGGQVVWAGEQPRERRPPPQNRTYSDCML